MPLDVFWYEDEEYFEFYVQAYYENLKMQAWLEGQFNYVAYSAVVAQMFGNKGEYPSYKEIENKEKAQEKYTEKEARDIISSCY